VTYISLYKIYKASN